MSLATKRRIRAPLRSLPPGAVRCSEELVNVNVASHTSRLADTGCPGRVATDFTAP